MGLRDVSYDCQVAIANDMTVHWQGHIYFSSTHNVRVSLAVHAVCKV